jgi:hypothetical protein
MTHKSNDDTNTSIFSCGLYSNRSDAKVLDFDTRNKNPLIEASFVIALDIPTKSNDDIGFILHQ